MTSLTSPPVGSTPPPRFGMMDAIMLAAFGVILVTAFGLLIAPGSGMTAADLSVVATLNKLHVGVLGSLTTIVYTVFSPAPAIAMTAVATGVIWLVSRRLLTGGTFAIVIAFTWVPSAVVKAIVHRPRPDAHLLAHPFAQQPSDASYPSGHEVFIATVAVVAFLMAGRTLARVLIGVAGVLAIALVAFSLLSDGVHYPSDVAASVVWSVTVAPALMLIWRNVAVPAVDRRITARKQLAL